MTPFVHRAEAGLDGDSDRNGCQRVVPTLTGEEQA